MSNIYNRVKVNRPGRSIFNLSYEKKFDGDMGILYPAMCEEMVPGDTFKVGNEIVIRFQPLVAPVLHEINVFMHYFFVPNRLIMDDWEEFISGGIDGETDVQLPRWQPQSTAVGSLWDYFGFPVGVNPTGALPLAFPKRAYNLIWNEYYRDQNLQDEKDLDDENLLRRSWEKDYFTSSLPWQQRGTAPALPVNVSLGGTSFANFTNGVGDNAELYNVAIGSHSPYNLMAVNSTGNTRLKDALNRNTIDLSTGTATATTFDVADLRLAFQVQKWMERNARAGVRYTEFLSAHFGISPRDERLQRPEYVGGSKAPVIISEVLQTSSTDATSPQGNLAGHGITASSNFCGTYTAKEFGFIVGLMSVMPRSAYQQGINRQFLRRTKYDYYFPEFANLSEQPIETAEIYATTNESTNLSIFGYQGRYNEMRSKQSQVCGNLRSTIDYWHLGRKFSSQPLLNSSFIECTPDKRIFAVPAEPGLIINIANLIKAIRPIPISAEPGYIDHN